MPQGGGLKLSVLIEAHLQPCISDNLIRTCIGKDDCQKHRSTNNKGAMNAVNLLSQPSHQDSTHHPHTKTPPFILTLNSSLHPHTKTSITLTPRLLLSPSYQESYPLTPRHPHTKLLHSASHQDSHHLHTDSSLHPHTKTPPFILTLKSSLHPHTKTPPITSHQDSSHHPHTKTPITLKPRLLSPSHQDSYHPHTKTPPFILTLNSSLHPHTKTPPITLTQTPLFTLTPRSRSAPCNEYS